MDRIYAGVHARARGALSTSRKAAGGRPRSCCVIERHDVEGEDVTKTVALQLGAPGDGRKRLADAGLHLVPLGDEVQIGTVKFGSRAQKSGFEQGWNILEVQVPSGRPSPHWFYLPALLLVALVWLAQGRRMRGVPAPATA